MHNMICEYPQERFSNIGFNASPYSRYVFLSDLSRTQVKNYEQSLDAIEKAEPVFFPLRLGFQRSKNDFKGHDYIIKHAPLALKSTG